MGNVCIRNIVMQFDNSSSSTSQQRVLAYNPPDSGLSLSHFVATVTAPPEDIHKRSWRNKRRVSLNPSFGVITENNETTRIRKDRNERKHRKAKGSSCSSGSDSGSDSPTFGGGGGGNKPRTNLRVPSEYDEYLSENDEVELYAQDINPNTIKIKPDMSALLSIPTGPTQGGALHIEPPEETNHTEHTTEEQHERSAKTHRNRRRRKTTRPMANPDSCEDIIKVESFIHYSYNALATQSRLEDAAIQHQAKVEQEQILKATNAQETESKNAQTRKYPEKQTNTKSYLSQLKYIMGCGPGQHQDSSNHVDNKSTLCIVEGSALEKINTKNQSNNNNNSVQYDPQLTNNKANQSKNNNNSNNNNNNKKNNKKNSNNNNNSVQYYPQSTSYQANQSKNNNSLEVDDQTATSAHLPRNVQTATSSHLPRNVQTATSSHLPRNVQTTDIIWNTNNCVNVSAPVFLAQETLPAYNVMQEDLFHNDEQFGADFAHGSDSDVDLSCAKACCLRFICVVPNRQIS